MRLALLKYSLYPVRIEHRYPERSSIPSFNDASPIDRRPLLTDPPSENMTPSSSTISS